MIQPLSADQAGKTTPLKVATASIKAQLLEKAKTDSITKWTSDTKKAFDGEGLVRDRVRPACSGDRHGDDHTADRQCRSPRRSSSCRS